MTDHSDLGTQGTKDDRQEWAPLGFEKVDIAEAEAGFAGIGADNTFYS